MTIESYFIDASKLKKPHFHSKHCMRLQLKLFTGLLPITGYLLRYQNAVLQGLMSKKKMVWNATKKVVKSPD